MKTAAKRVGLEVVGWGLLLAGIAGLVLPGPGLLMMFGGLAVLSQQYDWAAKRLDPIKYRALKAAADSVEDTTRIVASVLGVLFMLGCSVVWILDPPAPDWWPLPEALWVPAGGWVTGLTLAFSAVVAAALIVYSYRRFRGHPEASEHLAEQIEEADREYDER